MNIDDITAAIKSARLQRKASQSDMARLAGIPLRTYQRLESGDHGARVDTLVRVLDALGLQLAMISKQRPALDELDALYGNDSLDDNP